MKCLLQQTRSQIEGMIMNEYDMLHAHAHQQHQLTCLSSKLIERGGNCRM